MTMKNKKELQRFAERFNASSKGNTLVLRTVAGKYQHKRIMITKARDAAIEKIVWRLGVNYLDVIEAIFESRIGPMGKGFFLNKDAAWLQGRRPVIVVCPERVFNSPFWAPGPWSAKGKPPMPKRGEIKVFLSAAA